MIWLVLLIVLVVVFGLGAVLKAAFWALVLIALGLVALTLFLRNLLAA